MNYRHYSLTNSPIHECPAKELILLILTTIMKKVEATASNQI